MKRIIVNNISKRFKIGFRKHESALGRLVSFFSGREPKKEILVLKDISFSVEEGEILGIVGPNGSGKSTLLRIVAGIYGLDGGEVETNGKIISLINLNIGLQPRLSMRDNIYLCSSLFGISRKTIKKRFNSIVQFAELEKFVDTKLYQFSNGMLERLAFSIAIHCNPEILILDEVFEVGDESFKMKSAKKIKEFAKIGGSVLFVSHDDKMIKRYCDRVIKLEFGKIVKNK
jgi:ABC-type polysaccharide/polyol phosphate transport system ATPase subunit